MKEGQEREAARQLEEARLAFAEPEGAGPVGTGRPTIGLPRALDVLIAGTVLLLAAPLLVVVAILIRLDSRGPQRHHHEYMVARRRSHVDTGLAQRRGGASRLQLIKRASWRRNSRPNGRRSQVREVVPPAGFEPAPLPPEGSALSPELRGRLCQPTDAEASSAAHRPRLPQCVP